MDILVMMKSEAKNPRGDKMLMGDVCFIKEREAGCIRTRSAKRHPYRGEYWWVVSWDITILSTVEVL